MCAHKPITRCGLNTNLGKRAYLGFQNCNIQIVLKGPDY